MIMSKSRFWILFLLLAAGTMAAAQNGPETGAPPGAAGSSLASGRDGTPEDIEAASSDGRSVRPPQGFRSVTLGMELDEVKRLLQEDPLYAYRGDPDVSMLPQPQQTLIECAGTSYIRRAFFQFHEHRLYILILALDPEKLDYFTMYSTLTDRYGAPGRLDPSGAVWEFETLRLSLERPLSVKYIDTEVFERLQEEGKAGQDLRELAKERFLEQF
jgi:hypothetical protein